MKFELQKFNLNVPDEELIADVRSVATKLKQTSVSVVGYDQHGKFNSSTLKRRFGGSWLKVLEKAGLQITDRQSKVKGISNEELFKNLEEVWVKLGHQPRSNETRQPLSKYEATSYKRRFGTWMKALESFVGYINKEGDFSQKEIENLAVDPTTRHKTQRNINWRLRFIVMRRDNFKCKNCGRSPATDPTIILHVDHIRAWANGGETVLENLQTLCSKCNIGKSDLE